MNTKTNTLNQCKVAILATDGFEQSELFKPRAALDEAGADISIVSLESGTIKGWSGADWGESVQVDKALEEVDAADFDALMLPGGVMNPDTLRLNESAIDFIKEFVESGKPIAAICHAPWTLINAGGVKGRKVTSWPSLKTDLINAGAEWIDEAVVCDQGLVTSRNPNDIPAFNDKMIEEFEEGRHSRNRNVIPDIEKERSDAQVAEASKHGF